MNENIDLTQILKGCPKGTKLYSSSYGEVEFESIDYSLHCPIKVIGNVYYLYYFTKEGKLVDTGECTLFPSRTQRDWGKFERFWDKPKVERFNPKTLHPFDKILARDSDKQSWTCEFFSYINNICKYSIVGLGLSYKWCIPYNEETKHLIGTTNDCPDYYKWWEK